MNKRNLLLFSALALGVCALFAQSTHTSALKIGNKKGATVKGIVECDGKPVKGVVVSDGFEITRTDAKGAYYLNSAKRNGQVFISIPSGYEVANNGVVPAFWANLKADASTPERHDFLLRKVNNDKHALIAITDIHIINARYDYEDFTEKYLPRLREEVEKYKAQGVPVYTIDLGDSAWDRYWYENGYNIGDFRNTIENVDYPTQFFNVMGNHDNDSAAEPDNDTDFMAAQPYRKAFGPNYYSFNLGKAHYVVLDNIVYLNEKEGKNKALSHQAGIAGTCNYQTYISPEQMAWLRKDLAEVEDPENTPVFIAFHAPMFKCRAATGEVFTQANRRNEKELYELTAPFKEVHLLTGHTHSNAINESPRSPKTMIDHTVAGTCGAWWWTSAHGGHNICPDGNPVGFATFVTDGNDVKWDFQAFEYPSDKQFFVFDMNSVKRYCATNGQTKSFLRHYPLWTNYSELPENTLYISVWNYDPKGTLSVKENGKELAVESTVDTNPLYMATYMTQRTTWEDKYGTGYNQPRKRRMFKVTASAPDSPVEVSYTDRFGRTYKETIARPAVFDRSIF